MPKGVYARNTAAGDDVGIAPAAEIDIPAQLAEMQREREAMAQERAELLALKEKLERKAEIRTEVAAAISEQQMDQRRRDFGKLKEPEAYVMPPKPDEELIEIKLERNYAPQGYYEVVGWHKPEVVKKRPSGETVVVEQAEFVKGELAPPAIPGIRFRNKIWAKTVLRLPRSEAREVRKAGIGSVELSD